MKQLSVLGWIGDGCPEGVMAGYAHRISAASLRDRGLVTISGRGPSWAAQVTASGREYLERAAGPDPPIPRQASTSVIQQLGDDVFAANGSLRVPRKQYYDKRGVDYEHRAHLAERYGKVPNGKRLTVRAVSADELQIDLVDAEIETLKPRQPVPVPEKITRFHPAVKHFKERAERHEVSRAALPRVLRILQGLAADAERRGYRVETVPASDGHRLAGQGWTGKRDGHMLISVGGCTEAVRVHEEGLQSRMYWEQQNRVRSYRLGSETRRKGPRLSEYEAGATGRLSLELVSGYRRPGRPSSWADRRSWALEEKLPDLLHEIELRAAEWDERQREAREAAEERQRAWEVAIESARERYSDHQRAETLRAEVRRWRDAKAIRAYCDAAQSAHPDEPKTAEWTAWGRSYADDLDPLREPPSAPSPEPNVTPNELRPFLDGWDPYSPTRSRW